MDLSIITIGSSYSNEFLKTIKSVLKNKISYSRWVLVVFDEDQEKFLNDVILSKYKINSFIILSDNKGISSAMNIGIKYLLKYDTYIWFLHAGDRAIYNFNNKLDSLHEYDLHFFPVINRFKGQINENNIKNTPRNWNKLIKKKPCVNHQGVLTNIRVFSKYGLFSNKYSSIMDYEWFYRISRNSINLKSCFHNSAICSFELGGKSSNILLASREHFYLLRQYNKPRITSMLKAQYIFLAKLLFLIKNIFIAKVKDYFINKKLLKN